MCSLQKKLPDTKRSSGPRQGLPPRQWTKQCHTHYTGVMGDSGEFGKKVFFLNPASVMEEVFPALANAEFEVYRVTHHQRLERYLSRHPSCLLFVNIDEGDDDAQWRAWIKQVKAAPGGTETAVGILSMLGDDERRNAYLMDLNAACFITLSLGMAKTTDILLKTLEANEARGRRRYVRASCPPDSAQYNCDLDGDIIRGQIKDLSSVGMAIAWEGAAQLPTGARLPGLQLNLKGVRLIVNGVVMGNRDDPIMGAIHLVMFEPASLSQEKRDKLRGFIRKTLQSAMDGILECY